MKPHTVNPETLVRHETLLELGRASSRVQKQMNGEQARETLFALGLDTLAARYLKHEPPLPVEFERAIEHTEDVVMPLATLFGDGQQLRLEVLGATLVAQAFRDSGLQQGVVTRDEIENLFNRLVSISEGRPPSLERLPIDRHFVAAVIVLREFMHHLGFDRVAIGNANGT